MPNIFNKGLLSELIYSDSFLEVWIIRSFSIIANNVKSRLHSIVCDLMFK